MIKNRLIKDSVHGEFSLSNFELKVMDCPQIQRLRRIKQLGFTSLIYPGANHSRFEHSIGTMYLGSKLADHLNLSKYNKKLVRIASLLHDVGHGPFSHASEPILDVKHEKLSAKVIKETSLDDILTEEFDTKEIIDTINGKGELGPTVSGELDVDRMDYLIRDSHYTGVAYGIIDIDRIISNLKLKHYLILDKKGIQAAESALVARYQMYPSVYQHHTTRIINSMFRRCLREVIKQKILKTKNLYKYDDTDIVSLCRNNDGFIKDVIRRLDNRNLLKTVDSIRLNEFMNPQEIFKIKEETIRKYEEEISEDFEINRKYVIINIPEYPKFSEMKTQVAFGDKLFHLSDISSIVGALKDARFNYPDICLYVPKEEKNKFNDFKLENYMDLPDKTKNKFDTLHTNQLRLFN
ncbi:MAG: HD domain-containing protein [Methanobrevibacter sp.]|jgi:HD superfamily phosphohydrolase|nr:HD domain-containing protein [Candidatus Methanovirga basalitermitum]